MEGQGESGRERTIVYCIVPPLLAARLHEPLRRYFAADAEVEVVVEQRRRERRRAPERRSETTCTSADERRRIRAESGRRVGERRAPLVPVDQRELPRVARRYAEQLRFVERVAPATQHAED